MKIKYTKPHSRKRCGKETEMTAWLSWSITPSPDVNVKIYATDDANPEQIMQISIVGEANLLQMKQAIDEALKTLSEGKER